jgi:phosphatidylserine/phosphatidylglycerophosphate/cardiolipin synthase-like enzyme
MFHKIASNHEIAPLVLDLIGKAEKQVDIISPYIKRWGNLDRQIEASAKREVIVNVIFREDKKSEYGELINWFHSLGVHLFVVKDLHSKIYCSEKACILTSMNLYDYSAANSEEVALYSMEEELIASVKKYVEELRSRATPLSTDKVGKVFKSSPRPAAAPAPSRPPQPARQARTRAGQMGFCIRCAGKLSLDPTKPLCPECYKLWNKYKNPNYHEKYCHRCGKPGAATLHRPLCPDCAAAI